MTSTTAKEWIAVANERAADAEIIQKERPNSIGSVYIVGYAIECSLKALLQSRGRAFPTYGQEGHNLKGLWEASGFLLSDLQDPKGTKSFFINYWNTALRYESYLPNTSGLKITELAEGGRELSGWIQKRIRRDRRN